jgi:HK97 family phage major capsid protein
MSEITLDDVNKAAEKAMQAFEGLKTEILPIKTKFDELDGETKGKFVKMEKSISDGLQASQNAEAKAKALEEGQKAQQKQLDQIVTALNRVNPGSTEKDAKALQRKTNKLFNEFARLDSGHSKLYFDEHLRQAIKDDPELKAMSADSDPNGGFLTLPEFGGLITTKVFETSPLRQLANVTQIGSDTLEIVVDYDEADASWTSERGTRSSTTTPTMGKIDIYAHEMYANPQVTQKMLDDGVIDVESWIQNKVADKFARKEATAFVTGSGVGQPKGIMSYTSGTTLSSGQVEQVVTTDASNLTYDGFINTQNALKEAYQNNAVWLYQRATNAKAMLIKDGEGRPIFNMNYDRNAGMEMLVLGKAVRFAADIAAVSASALAAAYGDFKQAYQIVDRVGLRILRDPYSNKPYIGFYTTRRVGGGMVNFEAMKIMKVSA